MRALVGFMREHPLYCRLQRWRTSRRQARELAAWERQGRPVPPPHLVKQRVLLEHARRYGLRVLVETGTYRGDMVAAMQRSFEKIYSIELGADLYAAARRRFAGQRHIEIIHGDSGQKLAQVMGRLQGPALFWLDGHYSAGETARGQDDTPVYDELRCILSAPDHGHVIIIDDARCFGSEPSYPTIEALGAFVRARRPDVEISVELDSLRITPGRSPSGGP